MVQGTVKKLWDDKYYGFAIGASGENIFFHSDAIENGSIEDLSIGSPVELDEIADRGRGLRAGRVRLLDPQWTRGNRD